MRRIIIALFFISSTWLLKSQEVKITIIDSLSNEPIPYASVCFIDTKTGTYTNENGTFSTDRSNHSILVSHLGYRPRTFMQPTKDAIIKLQPEPYFLSEITVTPGKRKTEEIGYIKYKSNFFIPGLSGDELAVYFPNRHNTDKSIQEIKIRFNTSSLIKKSLEIDFLSVFKVNIYSKIESSSEPDSSLLVKDMVFTSKIIKPVTRIDVSEYNLKLPANGAFISIEWVGIESETTKEIITNYKNRTEPFISTTFENTNTLVYERNKFSDNKWTLIDKINKFNTLLKEDNYYTPRISLTIY